MSLAVRTIKLTGEYYIDFHAIDVKKQLYSLGFRQEKENGNWIPPQPFLLHKDVKSGRITLSSDINKWHKVHFKEFIDMDGTTRKLIKLLYDEAVLIRYGKYEFENSIKFYDKKWFEQGKRLYQVFLASEVTNFEEWLKFPFKTKFGYIPEFTIPTLDRLKRDQAFLTSLINDFENKDSEIGNKEIYLEELSQNRFRSTIVSDEWADHEVFELINWFSFFCYELLIEDKGSLKIKPCKTCGSPIYLNDSDHSDRSHHKKSESLECWRKQERERKTKQRA